MEATMCQALNDFSTVGTVVGAQDTANKDW